MKRIWKLLAMLLALALVAAACGDGENDADAGGTTSSMREPNSAQVDTGEERSGPNVEITTASTAPAVSSTTSTTVDPDYLDDEGCPRYNMRVSLTKEKPVEVEIELADLFGSATVVFAGTELTTMFSAIPIHGSGDFFIDRWEWHGTMKLSVERSSTGQALGATCVDEIVRPEGVRGDNPHTIEADPSAEDLVHGVRIRIVAKAIEGCPGTAIDVVTGNQFIEGRVFHGAFAFYEDGQWQGNAVEIITDDTLKCFFTLDEIGIESRGGSGGFAEASTEVIGT